MATSLAAGQTDPFKVALKEAKLQARALEEAARSQNHPTRLVRLTEAFGLQDFDVDVLLICLAPQLDLRYERIYGYLQVDVTKKQPTINLVLDLLCPPGEERLYQMARFSNHAPLFTQHLLESPAEDQRNSLLNQPLIVNHTVCTWLLGDYQPATSPALNFSMSVHDPGEGDELLAGDLAIDLKRVIEQKPILAFYGPDELAQRAAARLLSKKAKRPLLAVDYSSDAGSETSAKLDWN